MLPLSISATDEIALLLYYNRALASIYLEEVAANSEHAHSLPKFARLLSLSETLIIFRHAYKSSTQRLRECREWSDEATADFDCLLTTISHGIETELRI